MNTAIKYIEHKPLEHTDRAEAWIARVWLSASGRTVYFNGMALKKHSGVDSNHHDMITDEDYWVTGVKKRRSNRHWGGKCPIQVEESLVGWYERHTRGLGHKNLVVIPDLPKPEIAKFSAMENQLATDGEVIQFCCLPGDI